MDTTALTLEAAFVLAVVAVVFLAFYRQWASPDVIALAGAMAAALAYVRAYAPDADETVAEGDAAADAEDVAAGDGGDDAIGENADPSTSLQAPGETAAAMREERRVFEARLERIADRCATHVAELGDLARLCHKRMAAMVKQKL